MYNAHGWWFPDQDKHFVAMLDKSVSKGGRPVYQEPVRVASINFCARRKVALDIGANVGLWSRDLCQHFQQVHAIEPVSDFRDCLQKNVPVRNLTVHACALGAQTTNINMIVTQGNTGHSHVDPGSMGQGTIPMYTLDSVQLPRSDYIKIDCEGYEYKIIQGGENYIKACRPVIVIEQKFHKDTGVIDDGQAVELLKSWGARLLKQFNNDLILAW
jgi:FkbM family methyltransferase